MPCSYRNTTDDSKLPVNDTQLMEKNLKDGNIMMDLSLALLK